MLHEHETHAGVGGQTLEQLRERLEPTRRRSHANNGKLRRAGLRSCCLSRARSFHMDRIVRFTPPITSRTLIGEKGRAGEKCT